MSAAVGATLIETTGERKGRVYLLEDAPLVIGRSTEADIVVPNALMSRKHARVSWDGQRYVVEDLGTRNGTLVNREQITAPHSLKDGDEIALPGLVIVFRSSDETMMIGATPSPRVTTLTFLFADLRDYSAFVERRGDAAAAELIHDYRLLMRDEIAAAEGAEIKTEGDSFYVVFDTAQQALRCAIAIQRRAARRTAERADRPIHIGIGINTGEPVREGDGFVGSAVNVAARLAQNAKASEILISEVVRSLVRTSGIAPMEERTGITLKNIEDVPRIYAVDWTEHDPPA
jgi:class 3 adenylate cyclase